MPGGHGAPPQGSEQRWPALRELSSIDEHAGKIRAAKGTQKDKDFVVVARTEALIAGWGMEEALKRGRAYADAGADMVLIHSKSKTPVASFAQAQPAL